MSWKLVSTRQAQRDAKKLQAAGLRPRAEKLLYWTACKPSLSDRQPETLAGSLSIKSYKETSSRRS